MKLGSDGLILDEKKIERFFTFWVSYRYRKVFRKYERKRLTEDVVAKCMLDCRLTTSNTMRDCQNFLARNRERFRIKDSIPNSLRRTSNVEKDSKIIRVDFAPKILY